MESRRTVEIRPTIPSDLDGFTDKPLPYRIRAITGLVDGEIVAVGGIAYLAEDTHGAFLLASETARKYPVALHKAGLQVLRMAKDLGLRKLVAHPDSNIEAAERWLSRLGFQPLIETENETPVWQWQQSSES